MALIHCDFRSDVLGMNMSMDAILPVNDTPKGDCQSLLLLHGLSDDHTSWQRQTSIERYVESYRLAVLMPAVHQSFYADMTHGLQYWTFISKELPDLAARYFRLSSRREDRFVAGQSMGGYGAFKLALQRPDCFSAAASLSGALDIAGHEPEPDVAGERETIRRLVFGNRKIGGSEDDLLACIDGLVESQRPQPQFYQWCGTEDYLYPDNVRFRDHAAHTDLTLTYEEGPGDHTWAVWDRQIQRVLEWLPLHRR